MCWTCITFLLEAKCSKITYTALLLTSCLQSFSIRVWLFCICQCHHWQRRWNHIIRQKVFCVVYLEAINLREIRNYFTSNFIANALPQNAWTFFKPHCHMHLYFKCALYKCKCGNLFWNVTLTLQCNCFYCTNVLIHFDCSSNKNGSFKS